MSFNTHQIYHPLIVNSGWTSQSISATTISAGTFYGGSLSATYVGNQNVTDQEFKYVSGTSDNLQKQLTGLTNKDEYLIGFQSNSFLTNQKTISSGDSVIFEYTNNNLIISSNFKNLTVSSTTINLSSQTAITNFNPSNWQVSDNVRSTHIIITGSSSTIISGLVGGTNGRIVVITNNGTGLIILENLSTKCDPQNRFSFNYNNAYFLPKSKTITLIYDNTKLIWSELYPSNENTIFNLYSDYLSSFQYPILFWPSPSTTGGTYYQNFNYPVNGVFSFSSKTNSSSTTSYSVSTLGRMDNPTIFPSVFISKVRINSVFNYTGFTDINTSLFVCNNTTNKSTPQGTNTRNCCYWITPVTSATYTDTTVWYYGFSNATAIKYFYPSTVKLSATTNNWVYFGCHIGTNSMTNTGSPTIFFHSFNGNEYEWDAIIFTNPALLIEANLFGLGSFTNKPSVSPEISIDWFGVIRPINYLL